MPGRSTFWNHDPPRARPAGAAGGPAGDHGDPAAPRRMPCAVGVPPEPSVGDPAPDTPRCSTRGPGRTVGAPRTLCRNGYRTVIGSPVDLDEVEELDVATVRPHPGRLYVTQVCGAPALPPTGSERQLRAFRFFGPLRGRRDSIGIGYAA